MTKLVVAEKSILFMNNMAGDDLWEYGHFLMSDYPEDSPPHELIQFKGRAKANNNSNGIHLTSISYDGIQLYGFPFLPIDVDPFDIEYPSPISGVVITQDMRMLDYFVEQDPNFHHVARAQTSRLEWAKWQGLPTVLAVNHAYGHKGKLNDLNRLVGMNVFCPVIWHGGEPGVLFFQKAINSLLIKA
jgi:hypothetical protein